MLPLSAAHALRCSIQVCPAVLACRIYSPGARPAAARSQVQGPWEEQGQRVSPDSGDSQHQPAKVISGMPWSSVQPVTK